MKSSAKKIELASVDDLFSTEESRQDEQLEKIQEIPLSELHPFKDHPFKVKDDDAMLETADSIKKYGVLVPAIARPLPDGGYELVAGHRRRRASELAGKETMPVIVRDLDDDAATIIMVDSNLQRENLLPSERAFAYKMKLEAIKHQGARTDLTSVQVEQKLSARDQVAKEAGERSGKAAFYDLFIDLEHSTNLRTTAKELDVPERRFVRFLLEKRFVYRTASGNVLPYAKPANEGLFCVKDYRKAGYSKKFREEHEEEILLHQAAKNAFDEMGVKKLPKVKELQTEYAKLLEEKKKTYAKYRRSREEMRELLTAKANVDRVLKMEVEQDVEKEKDHGQR